MKINSTILYCDTKRERMTNNEFVINISGQQFTMEIVSMKNGGSFLYCKPVSETGKFFFMNKNSDNEWEIQYRDTVSKNVLAIEKQISKAVSNKLKEILL